MYLTSQDRLERAFKKMPPDLLRELKGKQTVTAKTDPYFTKVRISAKTITVSGGVHTILVPKQVANGFEFAIGESMKAAGFPEAAPYDRATRSDTNLRQRGETLNNEYVFVDGISAHIGPRTDTEMLRRCLPDLYCSISMEGKDDFIKLGSPLLLGGGGGIHGSGQSAIAAPNAFDQRSVAEGFPQNGLPSVLDRKELEDPILWGERGKLDSGLNFNVELTRDITIIANARAANGTVGIPAFTPPVAQSLYSDTDGTFIEFLIVLHSVQVAGRSVNR